MFADNDTDWEQWTVDFAALCKLIPCDEAVLVVVPSALSGQYLARTMKNVGQRT